MKKGFSASIMMCIMLLIVCAAYADIKQVKAADLWYPGVFGSQWIYNTSDDIQTILQVAGYREMGGKTYKAIRESKKFVWQATTQMTPAVHGLPEFDGINPLLNFREGGRNRIYGYGLDANIYMRESFLQAFRELGVVGGRVLINEGDEWLLLDDPAVGDSWTVFRFITSGFSFGVLFDDILEIKGYILREQSTETAAGEFDSLVVQYTLRARTDGYEFASFSVWLSPGVGILKIAVENTPIGSLAEYSINDQTPEYAVSGSGKVTSSWARIKTSR